MRKNSRAAGIEAENAVALLLEKRGYTVIARNYHSRFGELDIVAEHSGFLVFVEVKFRRGKSFGRPAEAVTYKKKERIIKTAEIFLYEKDIGEMPVRFDVAEVYPGGHINIIEDAFCL